jgi:hypothetical protein
MTPIIILAFMYLGFITHCFCFINWFDIFMAQKQFEHNVICNAENNDAMGGIAVSTAHIERLKLRNLLK